jgi:YgiT-type zinc finger domain-containing protein
MFNCHICYSEESHTEYVNEIFEIDRQFHLVENIPATVCSRCGEEIFSSETTENIRVMLHNKQKPLRAINK